MTGALRKHGVVIAIDGPAGTGKSSVGRAVARALGYRYVDTGAMYRVVGILARDESVDPADDEALRRLVETLEIEQHDVGADLAVRILANGRDVTDAIREGDAGSWASRISTQPSVRAALSHRQRRMGESGEVVMEGRDVGTVVFPDADYKFFLDASPEVRAARRLGDLGGADAETDLERVVAEIRERDDRDRNRTHAPLVAAADAEIVDTSKMTQDAVVARILARCGDL